MRGVLVMSYVLGLDLGTSSLKGVIFDKNGNIVGQETEEYSLIHEKIGYSEQLPQDWIKAFEALMNKFTEKINDFASGLEAVSISGQMHGLVMLDNYNRILRPAILWNDTRTTKECMEIKQKVEKELLIITKNQVLEGFTLPKILWVQKNEKDLWNKVSHIMLPKDYLIWYLTGEFATEKTDAAGTLLLDLEKGEWSDYLLEEFQIDKKILPKIYDSIDVVGVFREQLQEKWNLKNKVKVVAGGADNACAALGAGLINENFGMVSIGTSGVFLTFEKKVHDRYLGKLHLFNHTFPKSFYSMGVTLSAGHSLHWFRDVFARGTDFVELLKGIENIEPGCKGLLFAPYIMGERTPYADSNIRGSFVGIDTTHTLEHFTRAVLEGVTFSLNDIKTLMENEVGKKFKKIVSVGGGAKSSEWLQIQADIFSCKVVTLKTDQGPAKGAAMLAMVAIGWYDNMPSCVDKLVEYDKEFYPKESNVKLYQSVYHRYKKLYHSTKEICSQTVK